MIGLIHHPFQGSAKIWLSNRRMKKEDIKPAIITILIIFICIVAYTNTGNTTKEEASPPIQERKQEVSSDVDKTGHEATAAQTKSIAKDESAPTPSFSDTYAQDHGTCTEESCAPGTLVSISASKEDQFYACDTEDKAIYANTVLGMLIFQYQLTGKMPNISPVTGEPEYEGKSKKLLDSLRSKAGVANFDELTPSCLDKDALKNKKFRVMNIKSSSDYAWVSSKKISTWIPRTVIKPAG